MTALRSCDTIFQNIDLCLRTWENHRLDARFNDLVVCLSDTNSKHHDQLT